MKVKLLKKLRKRFYWYKEDNKNCWSYYDKKYNTHGYAFIFNTYYINDMLLYELLNELGLKYIFKSLDDRRTNRMKK